MLPTLDLSVSNSALGPQHIALYHDVQKWLANERSQLGANRNIELANPKPTVGGISCELRKVVELEDDVREVFKKYHHKCGYVKCRHDDVGKANVYTVTLATDAKMDVSTTASGSVGIGARILDEPRALILLILLVCVCAAFTTSGQSWLSLARGLSALLSPARSHP
jgi:hypothetical protein